jgi:threonine dehydrogenase-like Zn-dependent dehydrogenase
MLAAVVRGKEHLELERLPVPEPEPGEVRVRVRACGVCGSDLHLFHSGFFAPGQVPGHEMMGEVDALGDGVDSLQTGEPVAIEPLHSCGTCDTCRRGLDALCRQGGIYGIGLPGGLAEYVTVPARRAFRVPAELDPSLAALTEPMAVVVRGVKRGNLEPGQRVLVLGAGSIGLLAVVAARALGAGEVWLTARHPHQAELGASLGASRVLTESDASNESLADIGRDAPIDVVIETVGGSADTLNAAGAAVAPGGTISVVGVFMERYALDPLPLFLKENTLAWSNCYTHPHEGADFETAVELVSGHRDVLGALNTHALPLQDAERALSVASDKKAGAIKVSVLP